jgi:hypothetical protein
MAGWGYSLGTSTAYLLKLLGGAVLDFLCSGRQSSCDCPIFAPSAPRIVLADRWPHGMADIPTACLSAALGPSVGTSVAFLPER